MDRNYGDWHQFNGPEFRPVFGHGFGGFGHGLEGFGHGFGGFGLFWPGVGISLGYGLGDYDDDDDWH